MFFYENQKNVETLRTCVDMA